MRSVYPFNIGRLRRSNAHGGRVGVMTSRSERPITLASWPYSIPRVRKLSVEEADEFFRRELETEGE